MWIESLRNAFRSLRSAPGFALTAIVSLSVGIGASVAMFTVVNSVLLKPLALPDPGKLVLVANRSTAGYGSTRNGHEPGLLPLEFIRWRHHVQSFESIALTTFTCTTCALTGTGRPEALGVVAITADYFETLGVHPQLGRWFRESDETRGGPRVVILTDAFWRRSLSARPDIIGQSIRISGEPYEVVGVTPPTFRPFQGADLEPVHVADRVDVYFPMRFNARHLQQDTADEFVGIARLKPGVTMEQARAELDSTLTSIPEYQAAFSALKVRVGLREVQSVVVGGVSQGLLLLLLAVALVLLIACVNVANLSLVRATQRARELAVRVALGASRGDLVRSSMAESFLIALAGSIAGFLLSQWITAFALSRAPHLPRGEEVATDAMVFAFAIGICALTTALFGSLPPWQSTRVDPSEALSGGSRGNTDTLRGGRLRSTLMATEVAIGVVLVIGSGLLLRSFHQVMNAPRGFDERGLIIADVNLPTTYQSIEKQNSFFQRLHDDLISIPGVRHVAANTRAPIWDDAVFTVYEENSARPLNELVPANYQNVTTEYFTMMKLPLLAGRFFRDSGETEEVIVISESTARWMWPGQNPMGRRIRKSYDPANDYSRVVGVVGDLVSLGLDRGPTPVVYRPYSQRGGRPVGVTVMIQSTLPPSSLAGPLRQAVLRLDPDVPVTDIQSMTDAIANSVRPRAFQTSLLSAFALIAVFLAAVGIYGVVAYSIMQRRKEIGVRMALGADRKAVSRLVFHHGLMPVVAGLAAGLVVASFFVKLLASLLFHVRAFDPITFLVTPLVLILTAAVPCWLIARKASRFDPMDALRLE